MVREQNRYEAIIEAIFFKHYQPGHKTVRFKRSELINAVEELNIERPGNLGDVLYSFRFRNSLPESIRNTAPPGKEWIIRFVGRSVYEFALVPQVEISPSLVLVKTKIPDATPGIVSRYSLNDEQALLAKIRYNRLIDIFTGLTCYSLQNHLRTTIPDGGQVETDEIYVGIDKRGTHYVIPVQAKNASDRIGIVQVEQDFAVCASKFPNLICMPVAAQFTESEAIALFAFEQTDEGVKITSERHYQLVPIEDLTDEELMSYRHRL